MTRGRMRRRIRPSVAGVTVIVDAALVLVQLQRMKPPRDATSYLAKRDECLVLALRTVEFIFVTERLFMWKPLRMMDETRPLPSSTSCCVTPIAASRLFVASEAGRCASIGAPFPQRLLARPA